MIALDEERQRARRADCLPCCVVPPRAASEQEQDEDPDPEKVKCCVNVLSSLVNVHLAPGLMNGWVKACVLLAAAGLASISIVGLLDAEVLFRREWFVPEGSYLKEYFVVLEDNFGDQVR